MMKWKWSHCLGSHRSCCPQGILTPVINVGGDTDSDGSVVEFQPLININTVDRSEEDSGILSDMVGGPGLGYAEGNSDTPRSSTPSAPAAVAPQWTDLRDRTTARGMSRRIEALRSERSQAPAPRRRPNHQMPDSMPVSYTHLTLPTIYSV